MTGDTVSLWRFEELTNMKAPENGGFSVSRGISYSPRKPKIQFINVYSFKDFNLEQMRDDRLVFKLGLKL